MSIFTIWFYNFRSPRSGLILYGKLLFSFSFLLLQKKGIKFEKHIPILGQPDIFIEPNTCIFADGDYWHGNPTVFSPNDEITSSGGRKKVWEIWEKDEKINQKLIQKGYNVLRLWEDDIKNNPEKCLRKIIKIIKESKRI